MRGRASTNRSRWPSHWNREWLLERADVQDDGCWNWTMYCDKKGYGRANGYRCTGILAHRLSYVVFNGDIPEGLTVDHLCENKSCVNPDHLEIVSIGENARRWYRKQESCKRGHPYTEASTKYTNKGSRYCGICLAASIERSKLRKVAS